MSGMYGFCLVLALGLLVYLLYALLKAGRF